MQLLTEDPDALFAVLAAKFVLLTTVKLAAMPLVAACLPLVLRLINRGTANTAKIPINTRTTINSTTVNPFKLRMGTVYTHFKTP